MVLEHFFSPLLDFIDVSSEPPRVHKHTEGRTITTFEKIPGIVKATTGYAARQNNDTAPPSYVSVSLGDGIVQKQFWSNIYLPQYRIKNYCKPFGKIMMRLT